MSVLLGPTRQVGYIEAAMQRWIQLGIGPWFYQEDAGGVEYRYYGQSSRPPRLAMAIAGSGGMQLELIQQLDDAPSLYRDTLAVNGEYAQHIAFWTTSDFDGITRRLLQHGYVEGHVGRMSAACGPFAYFLRKDFPSAVIEVTDLAGGKTEYYGEVRRAAHDWDGANPVRLVSAPK